MEYKASYKFTNTFVLSNDWSFRTPYELHKSDSFESMLILEGELNIKFMFTLLLTKCTVILSALMISVLFACQWHIV